MSEGSVTRAKTPNLSRLIPAEIAEIFGHPPVLITENREAYNQLMSQLVLEWKPSNITEWMFVRDIADISWEIFRHRRAIANTFAISFRDALAKMLKDLPPKGGEADTPGSTAWFRRSAQSEALADAWFEGPKQQKKVKAELMNCGLDPEALVAQTYSMKGEVLDRLHRLLALAEARRTAITRNFNEYRAMAPLSERPIVDSKEVALVPSTA